MTKKHFELFARLIAAEPGNYIDVNATHSERELARGFAAWLVTRVAEESNPRFNRARFLAACERVKA